jgi:hypothetical protein
MINFNDAKRAFNVIPAGTIATLRMTVRPGNAGEGGLLRRSKDRNSAALDCEFTVLDGPFAKRKFWGLFTLEGTTGNHETAAEISMSLLRAILESARGFRPDDNSDEAQKARQVASYGDFSGLCFIGRIGVEPPQIGYAAKNKLAEVITPDRKDWHHVEQITKQPEAALTTTTPAASTSEPVKIERPKWAK